jgi:hypothetical protein
VSPPTSEQYPQWRPYLQEFGECEVKHGVRIHAFNLHTDELGNSEAPKKFKNVQQITPVRRTKPAVRLDPKFALGWALLSYVDARGYLGQTL